MRGSILSRVLFEIVDAAESLPYNLSRQGTQMPLIHQQLCIPKINTRL